MEEIQSRDSSMRDFARHVKNVAEMSQHLHHVTKLAMSVLLTRPMRAKEKKVLGGHGLRAKVVGRGLHHNFFSPFGLGQHWGSSPPEGMMRPSTWTDCTTSDLVPE